jgi:hypothetical protein
MFTYLETTVLSRSISYVHSSNMPSVFSTSSLATARETTGILIPSYGIAPGAILKAAEEASSVVAGSTDEEGEYLSMSVVESMLVLNVPDGSIIILPMTPPTVG